MLLHGILYSRFFARCFGRSFLCVLKFVGWQACFAHVLWCGCLTPLGFLRKELFANIYLYVPIDVFVPDGTLNFHFKGLTTHPLESCFRGRP